MLERDTYSCQWPECGRTLDVSGGYYSLQHRRARGMGGSSRPDTNSPSNLISMCGTGTTGCHGFVEANPGVAALLGFRLNQKMVPANEEIRTYTHGVVRLLDDATISREG